MDLYLIGIDYKSVPISLREPLYRRGNEIASFWKGISKDTAVLFTCNRIEVYGVSEDIFQAAGIIKLFQERFPRIFEISYVKNGIDEVIEHALRLSCGLKSQVIGEEEIVKQLSSWIKQDSFPYVLKKIWEEVLTRAQEVRVKSGLKGVKNNIATLIFKDLGKQKEIVVVGTGKIAQVFSENKPQGVNLHFVACKKHKRARQLARQSGGRAILFDDLRDVFLLADAVVSATKSPHYVLKKRHFSGIAPKPKGPLYLYDLAVPRDIEPDIADIPGIFLQNLDDLGRIFKQHNSSLSESIKKAELLILHHIFEISRQIKENINAYSY